jgi:hypothetical protein
MGRLLLRLKRAQYQSQTGRVGGDVQAVAACEHEFELSPQRLPRLLFGVWLCRFRQRESDWLVGGGANVAQELAQDYQDAGLVSE